MQSQKLFYWLTCAGSSVKGISSVTGETRRDKVCHLWEDEVFTEVHAVWPQIFP